MWNKLLPSLLLLSTGCSGLRSEFPTSAPDAGEEMESVDGSVPKKPTVSWQVEWFQTQSTVFRFKSLCAAHAERAFALVQGTDTFAYSWQDGGLRLVGYDGTPFPNGSHHVCRFAADHSLAIVDSESLHRCKKLPCVRAEWETTTGLFERGEVSRVCIQPNGLWSFVQPANSRALPQWSPDAGTSTLSLPTDNVISNCSVDATGMMLLPGSNFPTWVLTDGGVQFDVWGSASVSRGPLRRDSAHLAELSIAVGDGRIVHLKEGSGAWLWYDVPLPMTQNSNQSLIRPQWDAVVNVADAGFLLGGMPEDGYSLGWVDVQTRQFEWLEVLVGHRIYQLGAADEGVVWATAIEEATGRAGLARLTRLVTP